MTATIVQDVVNLVRVDRFPDGSGICLVVANPSNDYEGFINAPAVLSFEGILCGKSAYDTDLGQIFYRSGKLMAWVYRA